ncbi:MAG: hypothetical protein A2161_14045 [Candidatus Schekmanbacteria bacterium RBG_13_48_7]|uniref:NodB homology domain-containing protein n=1 Tax=Candidatus Schekmanbacteria bacterium RBG_13_48_7 TaxID=1817878 RepID=A0A1F7RZF0_9BACT|nr:MAG: hypothetical protein A2161_14045 [Candidatus Schekmanbacteria bacterium RBG_13_48_7]
MIRAFFFAFIFFVTHSTIFMLYPFTFHKFLIFFFLYTSGTIFMIYLIFYPRSQLLVSNRSQVHCPEKRCIALTFDDGPSGENTREILRILREKNVKVTFFVIGKQAEENPEQIVQSIQDGHFVANHTYSHPNLFCFLTPSRLRKEIEGCSAVIERITGMKPRFFRSPVGLRHPLLQYCLKKANLEYISWNSRIFDTFNQNPELLKKRLYRKIRAGNIVLLHDGTNQNVKNIIGMLPEIIDEFKSLGYMFVQP